MKTLSTPLGTFDTWDTGTITRALEAGQWWDAHLKPVLEEREGGWALDLGAHIGWFSCFLAQRHLHVIAVEPFPATFQLLTENMRYQHPGVEETVERWPVAAYDRPTTLHLASWIDATDMGGNCFVPDRRGQPETVSVPAIRLDDYLPVAAPITVIKVDCQGADLRALLGLEQTIARCRPLIVFEWEAGLADWHGHTWADYEAWGERMGYSIERITTSYYDYVARPV